MLKTKEYMRNGEEKPILNQEITTFKKAQRLIGKMENQSEEGKTLKGFEQKCAH